MKQGDKYMKLIMLVLVLMVTSYVLYSMLGRMPSRTQTVQAVLFSATEGVSTQGAIVRREQVIPASFGMSVPTKAEGQRVKKDEEVAVSLKSDGAKAAHQKVETKTAELNQLQQALSYQSQLTDSQAVAQKLEEEMGEFAACTAAGKLDSAQRNGENIKALVLRQSLGGETREELQAQVSRTQEELDALKQQATTGSVPVKVPVPGYYSRVTDGYESVLTPELLEYCTAQEFTDVLESQEQNLGDCAGRLITSSQWYYAAQTEPQYLEKIEKGDRLQVSLDGETGMELTMEVWRVDPESGFLVLTTNQYPDRISDQREMQADVIFRSYEGLRVPKEAICYQEDQEAGQTGVYVLVNREAIWKPITLIYDVGEAYIAELDQSETKNLWPGDLILTDTENLYNGKVVG